MKGTADLVARAGGVDREAVRQPPSASAVRRQATARTSPAPGRWRSRPAPVRARRQSNCKQDGEKLTGHYSGQLGEAAVTGTVKGTGDRIRDRHLRAGHSATCHLRRDGGRLVDEGTVKLGDLGEGTFTGTRK